MGTLLTALVAFHFWGWYGVAGYVVFQAIIGLVALVASSSRS